MKIKSTLLTLVGALTVFVVLPFQDLKIGLSIDDLRLERWQKIEIFFVNKAESMGAKYLSNLRMVMIASFSNRKYDVYFVHLDLLSAY